MAKVQVLGTGCSNCGYLLKNAQSAALVVSKLWQFTFANHFGMSGKIESEQKP